MSFFISLTDHEINKKFNFHITETLINYWNERSSLEDTFLIDLGKRNINFSNARCWKDVSAKNHTGILMYSIIEFLKHSDSKDYLDDLLFCCTSYVCVLKQETNININYLNLQRIKNNDILINAEMSLHVHVPNQIKKFQPKLVVDNDI